MRSNKKPLIAACAAAATIFATGTAGAAPVTWSANGHQYELVMNAGTSGISWSSASQATTALGGGWHLATITSAAEQAFIVGNLLNPNPTTNPAAHFWLGGSDQAQNNVWTWVTGEAFSFFAWNAGEPNGGTSEGFLALDARGGYLWNDVPNDIEDVHGGLYAVGYVMERSAVPEPGSIALLAAALGACGLARRRAKAA